MQHRMTPDDSRAFTRSAEFGGGWCCKLTRFGRGRTAVIVAATGRPNAGHTIITVRSGATAAAAHAAAGGLAMLLLLVLVLVIVVLRRMVCRRGRRGRRGGTGD